MVLAVTLFYASQMLASFALTVPPASRPNLTPATIGLAYETWETTSADGLRLKAWWVPPAPSSGALLPPVLVIHGLGAGKEFMLSYIKLVHEAGMPVLAIDLRGHGESAPSPTTLGAREPLDVAAWVTKLRKRGSAKPILWGTSLGAVTALRAAAADPDGVGGVIADAPFDTLRHTMAIHARLFFGLPAFPLVPLTVWQAERRMGFRADDVDTLKAATAIHVPVFIIAAENDRRMPLASTRAIFAAANEPKRFYLIPGEDHETRRFAPEFRGEVTAFLEDCGRREGQPVPATPP